MGRVALEIRDGLSFLFTQAEARGTWVAATAHKSLFCACLCGPVHHLDAVKIQVKMKELGWHQSKSSPFEFNYFT